MSKREFEQSGGGEVIVGIVGFALIGSLAALGIPRATERINQVNGIQLVDCSDLGLQNNTLSITNLNNKAEPIRIGGQQNLYGVLSGSLNISPDQHGGLAFEMPKGGTIEKIEGADNETIVFHSRGIDYEITSKPVDQFSTSLQIKASCKN